MVHKKTLNKVLLGVTSVFGTGVPLIIAIKATPSTSVGSEGQFDDACSAITDGQQAALSAMAGTFNSSCVYNITVSGSFAH